MSPIIMVKKQFLSSKDDEDVDPYELLRAQESERECKAPAKTPIPVKKQKNIKHSPEFANKSEPMVTFNLPDSKSGKTFSEHNGEKGRVWRTHRAPKADEEEDGFSKVFARHGYRGRKATRSWETDPEYELNIDHDGDYFLIGKQLYKYWESNGELYDPETADTSAQSESIPKLETILPDYSLQLKDWVTPSLEEWTSKMASRPKPSYNVRKAGEGEKSTRVQRHTLSKKPKEAECDDTVEYLDYPQRVGRQNNLEISFQVKVNRGRARRRGKCFRQTPVDCPQTVPTITDYDIFPSLV